MADTTAFKSKMPSDYGTPAEGKASTQDVAYIQGIERDVNTLNNPSSDNTKSNVLRTVSDQTGTSYTFVLTDSGAYFRFANAAAISVTVPPNSAVAFKAGTQFDGVQGGAGKVTFAAGSGVTINSLGSNKSLSGQYAPFSLVQTNTQDTWDLVGNLTV